MRNTHETTWYIVADATRARVVTLQNGPVRSTGDTHPTIVPALNEEFVGRNLKSREVLSDHLGQRAPGHPATPADPHENAKAGFALELAQVLDKALNERRFDHLVLTAPPDMLGKIRNALTSQVSRRILREEDKDLVPLPDNELAQRLVQLAEQPAGDR